MPVINHNVWVCATCGHEEVAEGDYKPGDSEPCVYCYNGTATVFEKDVERNEFLVKWETHFIGRPCAFHKEPILPNWMDLPLGYCLCGRIDIHEKRPS